MATGEISTGEISTGEISTVNNAGTSATVTELDAANATAPAFTLTNTGIDTSLPA